MGCLSLNSSDEVCEEKEFRRTYYISRMLNLSESGKVLYKWKSLLESHMTGTNKAQMQRGKEGNIVNRSRGRNAHRPSMQGTLPVRKVPSGLPYLTVPTSVSAQNIRKVLRNRYLHHHHHHQLPNPLPLFSPPPPPGQHFNLSSSHLVPLSSLVRWVYLHTDTSHQAKPTPGTPLSNPALVSLAPASVHSLPYAGSSSPERR